MEFKYVSGTPTTAAVDVLALCVPADGPRDATFKALDKSLRGQLTAQIDEEGFRGRPGESLLVRPRDGAKLTGGTRAVAVLGAGPRKGFDVRAVKDLAADAVKAAGRLRAKSLGFIMPAVPARELPRATQLAALGAALAAYRFDRYRGEDSRRPCTVTETSIIGPAPGRAPIKRALDKASAVSAAVALARDFINEPAARMTPRQLADEAKAIAKQSKRLSLEVLGPSECQRLGMGMFLAVGQGSDEEVRLIHMTYKPARKSKSRIALIGKGVTFDSGGYSLKPTASMLDMKIDMSGAAAVLASMGALAALDCPHEVHAIAACAENLVSGRAYKLGDVLASMSGKTVEINNTDAEGRLTLGDAITYALQKVKPTALLDFATLTGACVVALGPTTAGVMSNDDELAAAFLTAAAAVGEDMWRLPLTPSLREQLRSPIADMRNTGGRPGGALVAGLFLKEFVGDTPWVHVDIAGPASAAKDAGATAEGGTGFAVATIVEYLVR